VKVRCAQAGLDADFSAHSLRSGFVTEASVQGTSLADIMAMSGHASVATVLRYHRRASARSNPAARLLGASGTTRETNDDEV
jgi:integrase